MKAPRTLEEENRLLRSQVDGLCTNDRQQGLLDKIAELEDIIATLRDGSDRAEVRAQCAAWGFTASHTVVFLALRSDRYTTIPHLLNVLYRERADQARKNIISVMVYFMRKKMKAAGATVEISTLYGTGYIIKGVTT